MPRMSSRRRGSRGCDGLLNRSKGARTIPPLSGRTTACTVPSSCGKSDRAVGVQIGGLQRLRDFDLSDVEVRARMQERYGSRVPLDEVVISPAAMFAASNLVTVSSR